MRLRHYLEQGISKAELSGRFGVSRRTIDRWVESGQLDLDLSSDRAWYSPRPRVAYKVDPYKELIEVRFGEFPKLSAKRLFDEVRAAGYDGGYSRVRDYVREVRPRPPQEPPVRFETPAGHQGQVEFGTFRLPWGPWYALLVVLGYSRVLWLRF
ncbi:MAG: helix-turn-helix domain-containing protein [Acidobacteriota bacterium]|nr:helix-turn-helix domain-containing protein [Acidobacteriota bacterium]MDE3265416.1 helix-turn-helix domain-containing protein [Acidobacteriota bacterium]